MSKQGDKISIESVGTPGHTERVERARTAPAATHARLPAGLAQQSAVRRQREAAKADGPVIALQHDRSR
jgi:hypothetical protein